MAWHDHGATDGPFSVFPVIRHAHRTAGFFKVRGISINHQEFEDFMFDIVEVSDFKAEAVTAGDLDQLRLTIEITPGTDGATVARQVAVRTKATIELTPEVVVVEPGALAKEFESAIKAPRFVDRRD